MDFKNETVELAAEMQFRSEHERLHAKHKGHEAMHLEMVIIMFAVLGISQVLLIKWRQTHFRSYQATTLFGMWLFPLIFNLRVGWYRMLIVWLFFTLSTLFILRIATRNPLNPHAPRIVYKWFLNVHRLTYAVGILGYVIIMCTFFGVNLLLMLPPDVAMNAGVTIIFYGLYFGVLGRDCAEVCTEKMAAKMGYFSESGLPSKRLLPNICSVCGLELTLSNMEDVEEENKEKTYKLSCGHLFHEFCIRGWCIVGKKQTCPYCKEKVDLKRMFKNPWERPHLLFGQLLDWIRYFVVWLPIIVVSVRGINYMLGLE
ncbi:E3 ubiquitin ligase Rnf121 isoform X1 [Hydra vulgaris]|uniref:E3 ubiquitin ligase Rnf121 isoform X1 n=1 Tax=Hydra vulgaris TaxID=6087 RepID=UPI001F5F4E0E|nr:RING finger protein 121 isoform X1 [Hydra vulgaris]